MKKKTYLFICSVLLIVSVTETIQAGRQKNIDYELYNQLLRKYINDQGLVHYRGIQKNRTNLDIFIAQLSRISKKEFRKWSEQDQLAFLINAYNARTIQLIIQYYPIRRRKSIRFPKDSIRQIPGVWDKETFKLFGKKMTLDKLKHEILRKQYNEPRIHVALVSAAKGCPILRKGAYIGSRLHEQLDDQIKMFLTNPIKNRIDKENGIIYLSSIFKWFGEDFIKNYGMRIPHGKFNDSQRAVLGFMSGYLDEEDQHYLANGQYKIQYIEYDWSFNVQERKESIIRD
jgi:hypothetical protein